MSPIFSDPVHRVLAILPLAPELPSSTGSVFSGGLLESYGQGTPWALPDCAGHLLLLWH